MKSTTKKILTYTIILLLILAGVILIRYSPLYYYYFLFVGVDGRIVEDNSFLEKACKMKPLCSIGTGTHFSCEIINKRSGEIIFPNQKELSYWKGYKGCNNLTKYYVESEDDIYIHKAIQGVKTCGCENIIG